MPKFFYIARNDKGERLTGSEEAASADELAIRVQSRNLTVIDILSDIPEGDSVGTAAKFTRAAKFTHSGVKSEDLAILCRQLATLLGSGVTILKSLEIILQQISSRRLHDVVRDLKKSMEQGFSFHEAMTKHPKVFSELWVNLVESGEASGNLAVILTRLATYLERNAAFKRKIISAIIYPAILLLAGTGALLFLTIKIIPTFVDIFKSFKVELPLLTQMLVSVSFFIRKSFIIILILGAIGFWMLKNYIKTRPGKLAYEKFLFSLPVFGEFFRALVVERFASEMSTLVESGVPILYSLDITERSVDNLTLGNIINRIKEDVREGKPLNQPLAESGFFEPMVTQMISIGEEIGELPQMFKRINSFYEEYVETFLARFTAMFEPIILIFMGAVIGIMVIGLFLPIFQIAKMGGKF